MNDTLDEPSSGYNEYSYIHFTIAAAVALCLCVAGLVGNVIVFWYLCFKIQRNKYTVYFMNLSAANALFLIFTMLLLMVNINTLVGTDPDFIGKENLYLSIEIFYDAMQYSGMFIFTAVSMERCSSVLFPFWYQSHRPRNLSTIMCTALWIFGCLESLSENLVCTTEAFMDQTVQCSAVQIIVFVLAIGICLPIMVISSFTLLAKVKRTFKQQYTFKLHIIIIVVVFFFILSVLPFNFLWFLMFFRLIPTDLITASLFYATVFCTVLNCTVNPYIYIIVGRKWNQTSCHSIQETLQRAFREEENEDSKSIPSKHT
ncbi:PREDICTED: mas-related G-protein coupled receptor member H-like [Nanorana parkeri]|uniref:mas-related G-protein coupled receptor member H-like n=1 Tax=Nanorana parkeri TaxID=125878 RepID=UPI000854AF11|nr:PREDICTED: mas-related G-protein coupled receptor member H-like [Nanorana parkeri]